MRTTAGRAVLTLQEGRRGAVMINALVMKYIFQRLKKLPNHFVELRGSNYST